MKDQMTSVMNGPKRFNAKKYRHPTYCWFKDAYYFFSEKRVNNGKYIFTGKCRIYTYLYKVAITWINLLIFFNFVYNCSNRNGKLIE